MLCAAGAIGRLYRRNLGEVWRGGVEVTMVCALVVSDDEAQHHGYMMEYNKLIRSSPLHSERSS
jgi:hypothetical protein